jgi:hypothetical protein
MHGGPMPAQSHRVNAAKGRVVEWTCGWWSGWSESRELRQGGRARTTASNGLANDLRLESPAGAQRQPLARREGGSRGIILRHEHIVTGLMCTGGTSGRRLARRPDHVCVVAQLSRPLEQGRPERLVGRWIPAQ